MSIKKDYTNILYIRGLSPGLKGRFKAYCAVKGSNMTIELERLITRELSRYQQEPIQKKQPQTEEQS